MPAYWLENGSKAIGCVEADSEEEAKKIAKEKTGIDATGCSRIPYPSTPRLNEKVHKDSKGKEYVTPSFCYRPEQCKGRSSCPQDYACTE